MPRTERIKNPQNTATTSPAQTSIPNRDPVRSENPVAHPTAKPPSIIMQNDPAAKDTEIDILSARPTKKEFEIPFQFVTRSGKRPEPLRIDVAKFDTVSRAIDLFFPNSILLQDFNIRILQDIDNALTSRKKAITGIKDAENELLSTQDEMIKAQEELTSVKESIENKKWQLGELEQSSIQEVQSSVQSSIGPLKKLVKNFKKTIEKLRCDLELLQNENLTNEMELGDVNIKIIEKRNSAQRLKRNSKSWTKAQDDIEALVQKQIYLQTVISGAKPRLDMIKSKIAMAIEDLKEAKEDLKDAKKEAKEDLKDAIKEAKEDLKEAKEDLKEAKQDLLREAISLDTKTRDLEAKEERLEALIRSYEQEKTDYELKIINNAKKFGETILVDAVEDEEYLIKVQNHIVSLSEIESEKLKKELFNEEKHISLPYLCESVAQERYKVRSDWSVRFQGRNLMREFCSEALVNTRIESSKTRGSISGNIPLMLYGTRGSGKSHMMLALVSYLLSRGERVIYFAYAACMLVPVYWGEKLLLLIELEMKRPDTDWDFIDHLKSILSLSRNNPISELLNEIKRLKKYVYICIDQFDSLNLTDGGLSCIQNLVTRFAERAVLASSANDKMALDRVRGSSAIYKRHYFDVFKGYTEKEFGVWRKENDKENKLIMNESQLELLRYGTGLVPLYLDRFLEAKGHNFKSKYYNFEVDLTADILDSLNDFYDKKLDKISKTEKKNFLDAAIYCLRRLKTYKFMAKFIVNSFYYIGSDSASGCCCGVAEKLLRIKVRDLFQSSAFTKIELLRMLSRSTNGCEAGFIIEQIGLNEVLDGFNLPKEHHRVQVVNTVVSSKQNNDAKAKNHVAKTKWISARTTAKKVELIKPGSTSHFKDDFSPPAQGSHCHCYQGFHPVVDCLIVKDKTFYGINFTINKNHVDSVPLFMKKLCASELAQKIEDIRFIWWASEEAIKNLKDKLRKTKVNMGDVLFSDRNIKLYFMQFDNDVEAALKDRPELRDMIEKKDNELKFWRENFSSPEQESEDSISQQEDNIDTATRSNDSKPTHRKKRADSHKRSISQVHLSEQSTMPSQATDHYNQSEMMETDNMDKQSQGIYDPHNNSGSSSKKGRIEPKSSPKSKKTRKLKL